MKKTLIYIFTVVLSIFFGFALMYGLKHFYPNLFIKTITGEQKVVNVIDDGISEGIKNVYNSVVVVESYKNGSSISTGSGFSFKKDNEYNYIMTNHHVISSASEIIITLEDGSEINAELVGSDAYSDIAVLKVKNEEKLLVSKIGVTSDIDVGDTVFAVGSPMGKSFANTVTRGILSGKNRMVETTISGTNEDWIMNVMQTDAAINPGNSGGPLCNVSGEVIGINSLKIVKSSVEGLGFAIPIEDALSYAESIIKNGKIVRGYIGIKMLNANETFQLMRNNIVIDKDVTSGVVVVEVLKDSPASKSGLKSNDVIVKINDDEIKNISSFRYYLYKYNIGDTIKISVYRNGKIEELSIKVESSE